MAEDWVHPQLGMRLQLGILQYIKEMLLDVLSGEFKRGAKPPIEHVTDNISLKNVIYSNNQVKDKRLRIDLASLKQGIGRV